MLKKRRFADHSAQAGYEVGQHLSHKAWRESNGHGADQNSGDSRPPKLKVEGQGLPIRPSANTGENLNGMS